MLRKCVQIVSVILGIGIDVQHIQEMMQEIEEGEDSFLEKILTPLEIEYCKNSENFIHRVAGRAAAKEAVVKALSTGFTEDIDWLDFEVLNEPSGQPVLSVYNNARTLVDKLQVTKIWISISHSGEYAIAQVILEK